MITFIESGNRIATENFEIGEIYTITFTNGNYKTLCCVGIGSDFVMFQDKFPNALFCLTLGTSETVSIIELGGGGSGTMNYNELENKPQINGIVLIGNKTSSDLGLLSQADLDNYVTDTELTTELADYATNASVVTALASKQNQLTTPQLTAINSGITNSLVDQITTNKNNILYIENENSLRNIYPIKLSKLKELNTSGIWTDGDGISTYVDGTITYVYNITDSTITVTGYGQKNLFLSDYITIDNGVYYCSGCPSGGSLDTYYLAVNTVGWTNYNDIGNGLEVNISNNQIKLAISIKVGENNALNGKIYRPMIITNAARQLGYTTYKPYAPNNRELFLMLNQ